MLWQISIKTIRQGQYMGNNKEIQRQQYNRTEEHIEQPLPDEPKEEQSEPMGILTSRAHEDMTLAILQVQAAYGLPAYLTDLIVTAVLADIRGCANKDLLNALSRKE